MGLTFRRRLSRVKLASVEKKAVEKKPTRDTEAYTLYLKGRQFWNEKTPEGIERALRYFNSAIDRDPEFALGHSGLADCYLIQLDRTWLSFEQGIGPAKKEALRAVELDPQLAEAHASLGLVFHTEWDFAGAEAELKRAIELQPSYATAYHWYAILLIHLGRYQESLEQETKALELDPYSSTVAQLFSMLLFAVGRQSEGMARLEKLVKADPDFVSGHYWMAWAHSTLGEHDEAVAEMKKAAGAVGRDWYGARIGLVSIMIRAGRREEALKVLEEVKSETASYYRSPTVDAMISFDLGSPDESLSYIKKAISEHDSFLLYLRYTPWFASYRTEAWWPEIDREIANLGKNAR